MARTKGAKNKPKDSGVEITKDLAAPVIPVQSEESKPELETPIIDLSSIEDKILRLADDSKKANKKLLEKLDDNKKDLDFNSADDAVKYLNSKVDKKSGISKKQIVFILIAIAVFGVCYYKKDYIKDKLLLWWANRQLNKDSIE